MPNWCFNLAKFTFPDKETYNKFILAVRDESLFATFAPLELDSDQTWSIEKAVEKWGTKWEPSEWQNVEPTPFIEDSEYFLSATFDTAWAPPIGFYECLMKEHNIHVDAAFHEGGEEVFGKCVYNETISKNTYFNYPRSESQLFRVRQDIGINGELDSFMSCEWDRLLEIWEEKSDQDSI
jgi:hypothetical protein